MLPQSVKYLINTYANALIREDTVRKEIDMHRANYFSLRESQSKAERAEGERHRGKASVLTDELMSITRKKKDLEAVAASELVNSARMAALFKQKGFGND